MRITADEAREFLADIERRYLKKIRMEYEEDWSTPEGYDDSPDQGVHRYDGGGTFF